jgi:hypothetical protein
MVSAGHAVRQRKMVVTKKNSFAAETSFMAV